MKRKYKDDIPNNTIYKIRTILLNLDLFVYESYWGNPHKGTFSVRVEADTDGGQFGTNGKGRTRQYALASAYAEYAERLQNGFLSGVSSFNRCFLNQIKNETGFVFFPDEKIITKDDFLKLPNDFIIDVLRKNPTIEEIDEYFDKVKQNGYEGIIAIPFFDVKNNKISYLPYNLLLMHTGSNGMAAGNSIAEGSFQSLCELCEHYAASIVYMDRLTPPTIPIKFIKNYPNEYALIKEIEKSGDYKVIVKDFSAGKHLPAIGVIIVNKENTKYKLNVGSDTNFSVALSRALTEIYQGIESINAFSKRLLDIPQKEHDYFFKTDSKSINDKDTELRKFTKDGSGVFPKSLFEDNYSYDFDSSVFMSDDSYVDEVTNIIRYFISNGHNVYMRDTSFLGFPSYYIYIPFVSGLGKKNITTSNQFTLSIQKTLDLIEDLFFPCGHLTIDKIKKITKILDDITNSGDGDAKMVDIIKLAFKQTSIWNSIPVSFFGFGNLI